MQGIKGDSLSINDTDDLERSRNQIGMATVLVKCQHQASCRKYGVETSPTNGERSDGYVGFTTIYPK